MVRFNEIPAKAILQKLNQRLARIASGSRNNITATVNNGDVTLSGTIQFEHQRRIMIRAVNSVQGVRRVIDQVQVLAKKSTWT